MTLENLSLINAAAYVIYGIVRASCWQEGWYKWLPVAFLPILIISILQIITLRRTRNSAPSYDKKDTLIYLGLNILILIEMVVYMGGKLSAKLSL